MKVVKTLMMILMIELSPHTVAHSATVSYQTIGSLSGGWQPPGREDIPWLDPVCPTPWCRILFPKRRSLFKVITVPSRDVLFVLHVALNS